jgi:hypothetical protein
VEELQAAGSGELLETLLETRDPEFARLTRAALENPPDPSRASTDDDD